MKFFLSFICSPDFWTTRRRWSDLAASWIRASSCWRRRRTSGPPSSMTSATKEKPFRAPEIRWERKKNARKINLKSFISCIFSATDRWGWLKVQLESVDENDPSNYAESNRVGRDWIRHGVHCHLWNLHGPVLVMGNEKGREIRFSLSGYDGPSEKKMPSFFLHRFSLFPRFSPRV